MRALISLLTELKYVSILFNNLPLILEVIPTCLNSISIEEKLYFWGLMSRFLAFLFCAREISKKHRNIIKNKKIFFFDFLIVLKGFDIFYVLLFFKFLFFQ